MEKQRKRPRVVNAEPILFFYAAGVGFFVTGFQAFMMQKVCMYLGKTKEECGDIINGHSNDSATNYTMNSTDKAFFDRMQAETARFIMYFMVICNLPTVLMAFSIGSWSDQGGRKMPVVVALVGSALGNLVLAITAAVDSMTVYWTFLAAILNGLTGQMLSIYSCCFSMISDAEEDAARLTIRIGIASGVISLGILAGSLISGVLLSYLQDYTYVFASVIITMTISFLYTVFIARETLWLVKKRKPQSEEEGIKTVDGKDLQTRDRDEQAKEKMLNGGPDAYYVKKGIPKTGGIWTLFSLEPIKLSFKTLGKPRLGRRRCYLLVSLMCFFIMFASDAGLGPLLNLYVKRPPLSFSDSLFSYLIACQTATMCVGLLVLPWIGKHLFHISDVLLIVIGLAVTMTKLIMWAVAEEDWLIFVGTAIGGMAAIYYTGYRAFLSKLVDRHESGRLFAVVTASENVGPLLSSLIFNNIYAATVEWSAGFVYFVCVGFIAVALMIMTWLYIDIKCLNYDTILEDSAKDKENVEKYAEQGEVEKIQPDD